MTEKEFYDQVILIALDRIMEKNKNSVVYTISEVADRAATLATEMVNRRRSDYEESLR